MRVFIDAAGRIYKAEQAISIEDMERLNPSDEDISCLGDDSEKISIVDLDTRKRMARVYQVPFIVPENSDEISTQ